MFWRHFSRVVGLLARSPVLPSPCCVLVDKEKCPDVFYRIYFMIMTEGSYRRDAEFAEKASATPAWRRSLVVSRGRLPRNHAGRELRV